MPRTKSLQHYPTRYSEIVRECSLQGLSTKVELAGIKQALSLRGHWYAYVGSLKEAARQIEAALRDHPLRMPTEGEMDILELFKLAPTVMVQVDDHGEFGATLTFQSREHSWQARALRGGTTVATDAKPTAAGFSEAQERLMQIQKEMENDDSK